MRTIAAASLLALAACAGTPANPPAGSPLKDRAEEAFLKGEFSQAAALFDQVAALGPSDRAWAQLQAGRCRNGAEDWDGAIKSFTAALGGGGSEEFRLTALHYRAIAYASRHRFDEALADLAVVDAASPGARGRALPEDEFRFRYGVTRMRSGDWSGGRKELERLVRDLPQSPLAGDASDRLALRSLCIQIARVHDEEDAQEVASEARSKGFPAEVVPGRRGVLVVTGKFRSAADALVELTRVRGMYKDAFIVP